MKDFLGQEYGVGDRIVYAAMSGRCVNMVHARVIELCENGNVMVQPLEGARWQQHYDRTRYVDSRTGKGIDPYRPKHHRVKEHWTRDDQVYHSEADVQALAAKETGWNSWRYDRLKNYWEALRAFEYHAPVWHDYVQKVQEGPKPVRLQITQNIVKVGKADEV